jgi:phenylacetate-CoA ligase
MPMNKYLERNIELIDRIELEKMQLSLLNNVLERARETPYYKNKLGKKYRIEKLSDIREFPFTSKQDLRENFPYGFLAVKQEKTVRLHSSSGTTGNPTVVFHTKNDIENWSSIVARCMYMTGARSSDVFQNMMGYGLFTGGLGFHYGAEKLGMLTIPSGPGNSKRQIWFMQQFGTTVIHILPSYALRLAGLMKEMKINPGKDLPLRIAFIGAEPHSEEIRLKIEELLGIKAYNSYGLSEMCGPGVAFECEFQDGLHIWEDHFLAEIINPSTGEPVPEGEEGELVLTTLTREAMPLIRYRTRDLTSITNSVCKCGRTHSRLSRIKGRSDDMLIINGVNIFPIQIEKILMRVPQIGTNYEIHIYKENYMDKLHIKAELRDGAFQDSISEIEKIQKQILTVLSGEITVHPVIKLVEAHSLKVHEGKAVRVFDHRNE